MSESLVFQILETKTVETEISGQNLQVQGESTANNIKVIYRLIHKHKPINTLEVGLAFAASAVAFTVAMKEIHGGLEHTHHAIDPFQYAWMQNAGLNRLKKNNLETNFVFHHDFSENVLPGFLADKKKFDIIYIDGSHAYEHVFVDFFYTSRLLNRGGFLLFDDCSDKQVYKVIRFIIKNLSDYFEEVDVLQYTDASSIKKLIYPIAKKLGKVQLRIFRKITDDMERENVGFVNF